MGMFDNLQPVHPEDRNPTLETLFAYEEHFAELLKAYAPEIAKMEEMLRELRMERLQFYEKEFVEIQKRINEDPVLSEKAKEQWISELRANMEKSFQISEELLSYYVTTNKADFRKKMEEALKRL